jgi:hypothetical protein
VTNTEAVIKTEVVDLPTKVEVLTKPGAMDTTNTAPLFHEHFGVVETASETSAAILKTIDGDVFKTAKLEVGTQKQITSKLDSTKTKFSVPSEVVSDFSVVEVLTTPAVKLKNHDISVSEISSIEKPVEAVKNSLNRVNLISNQAKTFELDSFKNTKIVTPVATEKEVLPDSSLEEQSVMDSSFKTTTNVVTKNNAMVNPEIATTLIVADIVTTPDVVTAPEVTIVELEFTSPNSSRSRVTPADNVHNTSLDVSATEKTSNQVSSDRPSKFDFTDTTSIRDIIDSVAEPEALIVVSLPSASKVQMSTTKAQMSTTKAQMSTTEDAAPQMVSPVSALSESLSSSDLVAEHVPPPKLIASTTSSSDFTSTPNPTANNVHTNLMVDTSASALALTLKPRTNSPSVSPPYTPSSHVRSLSLSYTPPRSPPSSP